MIKVKFDLILEHYETVDKKITQASLHKTLEMNFVPVPGMGVNFEETGEMTDEEIQIAADWESNPVENWTPTASASYTILDVTYIERSASVRVDLRYEFESAEKLRAAVKELTERFGFELQWLN